MKKITLLMVALVTLFTACRKTDFDETVTGEGLNAFQLLTITNGAHIILNSATPTNTIKFTWNASVPGLHTKPTYKWVAVLKNGDINTPLLEVVSDNSGAANSLTLTQKQLDDLLAAKSIAPGLTSELVWNVKASNGTTDLLSRDMYNISITRFNDGATPFLLLNPLSGETAVTIDPGSTSQSVLFNWTKSEPAKTATGVKYKLLFAVRTFDSEGVQIMPDFTMPVFTIASNNSGNDNQLNFSHKALADSLNKYGYSDASATVNLYWTVVATSGVYAQMASYHNILAINRMKSYTYPQALNVPGGHQGWSVGNAPQLVAMSPVGGPYSFYQGFLYFPDASTEFKFVKGNDWGAGDYGMESASKLTNGGSNIKVDGSGVYLMHANTADLTWGYTKINSWGLIGSATPDAWNSDQDMTFDPVNKTYEITLNLVPGEIKFRANDDWGTNFGDDGNNGSVELNGANIAVATAGNYTIKLSLFIGGNWSYSIKKN